MNMKTKLLRLKTKKNAPCMQVRSAHFSRLDFMEHMGVFSGSNSSDKQIACSKLIVDENFELWTEWLQKSIRKKSNLLDDGIKNLEALIHIEDALTVV